VRRLPFLLVLLCLVLLLYPATAAGAPTFDQAIDRLIADGYPQALESKLCSMGTSKLGFRMAGTASDDLSAYYLAAKMRAMGLSNVHLEPVPVDEWGFRSASVTVGGHVLTASSFADCSPTGRRGITAPLVYVGRGTAADFEEAGDVRGKLVLIDADMNNYYMSLPFAEATFRGAAGIIYTEVPGDGYYQEPASLGSYDATYNPDFKTAVYVSMLDGQWLKEQLAEGPVTATMRLKVRFVRVEDGGMGFNVVGELPGRTSAAKIVLDSHHDAYFRAGLDDTGACVDMMMIAKAMKMSGYRPNRGIVFLFTTGEEYGRTNSYYDWLIGAWWAITETHPDWPGNIAAQISFEVMAQNGAPLRTRNAPELTPLMRDTLDANPELAPWGYSLGKQSPFDDQWCFATAGVPTMYLAANDSYYSSHWYHTDYDTKELVDYDYLGKIGKVAYRLIQQLDDTLLPYQLSPRTAELAAVTNPGELLDAGADSSVVARLNSAVSSFVAEATAYDARAASIPTSHAEAVNQGLLQVERELQSAFQALGVFDNVIYPHQNVLWDIQYLDQALAALAGGDAAAALSALGGVGMTFYGIPFSYDTYQFKLSQYAPDFPGIYWGADSHLPPILDVMPQYRQIEGGDFDSAAASLSAMRDSEILELNQRLAAMADVLESVTPQVAALQ